MVLQVNSSNCQLIYATEQLDSQKLFYLSGKSNTPDPDTLEKHRETPPISIAILLQTYALLLAESSVYTTNSYHNMPPTCMAILLQKYWGQGSLEHPQL